jgi:DNA repair photolyase
MRWDNLRIESEESRTLPGYREPATVRTFEAPEAMDTRFYEVRAKSALNRVPKASRMPFRWTINPYRGCTHSCVYCLRGDTPVLMADGRTKPIAELRPGDQVYGTARAGSYRRYVPTRVLDHWSTRKLAYRIALEDGTVLVASADHRFLTRRGVWKHVTGSDQGRQRRPHLTLNDELIGTGAFADAPNRSLDYRLGYVCGMVRGDGTLGSYDYPRAGRTCTDVHRFRLALVDLEPLQRTREFLRGLQVETDEFAFAAGAGGARPVMAIRTQKRASVAAIRTLIEWPVQPSEDWCKGFLAGIFDAEGSYSRGILRICNTDIEIIDHIHGCLTRLGLPFVLEDRGRANVLRVVRVPGGLQTHLRFFHLVDPATTRKRTIHGTALKSPARLQVAAIEPLGDEMKLYDITTGTGDFIANGVVSHNCFARPTHTYLDFDAGRDFEREIVVKVNAPEVARAELMKPSWKREHVALGTNTDPYQWVESRYRLMPGIWEAMRDSGTPCSVLTKSPLLLRDLELMKEIHERVGFAANLSIPTLEEKAWRATEPHTPHPRKRIEAVAEINRAGIPCGVLVAPLMPGVNDDPAQVEEILQLCAEAGAVHVGGIALHLRGEVKDLWWEWLGENRPDLIPRYERLYARGAYAPKAERERLAALARPATRATPEGDGASARDPVADADPLTTPPRRKPDRAPAEPEQTSLF